MVHCIGTSINGKPITHAVERLRRMNLIMTDALFDHPMFVVFGYFLLFLLYPVPVVCVLCLFVF